MARVETIVLACGICGGPADDGGHMGEPCPNETPAQRERRERREAAKLPTEMPKAVRGLVHASRCCGHSLELLPEGVSIAGPSEWATAEPQNVVMFTCSGCSRVVARRNLRTGGNEWTNGGSPWSPDDAPIESDVRG